jgi:hypothetical protein
MSRRFKVVAVIFLLSLCVLEPVLQNLDPWDLFPDAGDNIIVLLLILAACVAFVLCLAAAIVLLESAQVLSFSTAYSIRPRLAPARIFAPPSISPLRL